jgi:hypothetical protein
MSSKEMKITVELSPSLLREARAAAARKRTTLCALVEEGLRMVLVAKTRKSAFRLRKASFNGNGLRRNLRNAPWHRLLAISHRE